VTDLTEQHLRDLFAADAAGAPDHVGLAALALHTARRHRRARTTRAALLVAAAVVVGGGGALAVREPTGSAGPGAGTSSPAVADCSFGVRFEGTVFVGVVVVPFPADPVEQLGEAEVESCNDTGPPLPGATSPVEPERVMVSAYADYDPRQVLAIPDPEGGVLVLVSAALPRELWLQIITALHAADAGEQSATTD